MSSLSCERVIPLKKLESLAQRADDYSVRYDIPEEVYQSLLAEQEAYWEFLQRNPYCYGKKESWDKAKVLNRYISFMTMIRITEFMESKYKIG